MIDGDTVMRIWIIDHYSSEPRYGGISRQYDFARELSRRGHEVLVIASGFSHFKHTYISEEEVFISKIDNKANYVYLKTLSYTQNDGMQRLLNTLDFVYKINQQTKRLISEFGVPDYVVGCSIHPFTWIPAYKIAKKYSAHYIVEVRDLWPATWISDFGMSKWHPRAIVFGCLEKWAYKRAEKIIYSMSRGDLYFCDELGIDKKKTAWIGQPMDCERFDANAKKYEQLPNEIKDFVGNSFCCVFTGYYMEYEGVHEMLEAARIIQNQELQIKFVFVGSGQEEEKMKDYAEKNQLRNVLIYSRIDKELVPALLRRADICLAHLAVKGNPNSYKYDASKNKINEYMYSDSCIIYGTFVENQFVQTSGAGYTITPFCASEFAERISEVYLMMPEERKRFGEAARKYILENNTLTKLTDKYLEALELGNC
jgi:glycosyltransferase involved in cell wall biosynthesis